MTRIPRNTVQDRGLPEMTEQEVFTQSVTAIIAQGGPSYPPAYRDPQENRACAVGVLLSDEEYHPNMETLAVEHIQLPERLKPHLSLLKELQRAHDRMGLDEDLPLFLEDVAALGFEMPK